MWPVPGSQSVSTIARKLTRAGDRPDQRRAHRTHLYVFNVLLFKLYCFTVTEMRTVIVLLIIFKWFIILKSNNFIIND